MFYRPEWAFIGKNVLKTGQKIIKELGLKLDG